MIWIAVIVALLAILLSIRLLYRRGKQTKRIYFVGPNSTGKTCAILKLHGLDNKTVTTLKSHHLRVGNVDISELVPDNDVDDFVTRFQLNPFDRFIFFIKNEEEMRFFPNLRDYDVTFVKWIKSDQKTNGEVIYLDEDPTALLNLISESK